MHALRVLLDSASDAWTQSLLLSMHALHAIDLASLGWVFIHWCTRPSSINDLDQSLVAWIV